MCKRNGNPKRSSRFICLRCMQLNQCGSGDTEQHHGVLMMKWVFAHGNMLVPHLRIKKRGVFMKETIHDLHKMINMLPVYKGQPGTEVYNEDLIRLDQVNKLIETLIQKGESKKG